MIFKTTKYSYLSFFFKYIILLTKSKYNNLYQQYSFLWFFFHIHVTTICFVNVIVKQCTI